ncbi:hypothetical protein B0H17DRAFT_939605 [Mycena rosella]|uniref:Uncharacterized protein n=1 Tax=Mycena rosella TaxID=1033263 RepID=A0AAD7DBH2_MYCRO|nr:hypothetical protein B0H17DRAFT_939605 [Mycena rosella]
MRESSNGVVALYGTWIWRQVTKVVILRKNFRARTDPEYTNLLARVRLGIAWDGVLNMTAHQKGDSKNYPWSDFKTIQAQQLAGLQLKDQQQFEEAPVVCSTKVIRDLLNRELTLNYANKTKKQVHDYHVRDKFSTCTLDEHLQKCTWLVRLSVTKDRLGQLPMAIGMKVMVIENMALKASAVNGAEGILMEIKYSYDEKGRRYADCAYVEIKDTDVDMHPSGRDWVPIFLVNTNFPYTSPDSLSFLISRTQLPLLLAYAYIDYKSQGRSLPVVVVDLKGAV